MGGVDERHYRKEIYPGAVQFMLELARGKRENKWGNVQPPPLVRLLSARPQRLSFLRMTTTSIVAREFERVARQNKLTSWGLDLEGSRYGRLRDVLPAVRGDFRAFGRTKVQNWVDELGLDAGQAKAIFIGDNGQGDVQAAFNMAQFGPPFAAAFIHHVVDAPIEQWTFTDASANCFNADIAMLRRHKIHLFNGYLDASRKALSLGFISSNGHARIGKDVNSSNIARLCRLHAQDPTRFSRYPCIKKSSGASSRMRLFWFGGAEVSPEFALNPNDYSTRLRACGYPISHPEINRSGRCLTLLNELDRFDSWTSLSRRQWFGR